MGKNVYNKGCSEPVGGVPNCSGEHALLVSKMIGTAYDVVKYVALNMNSIIKVSRDLGEILTLVENLGKLIAIYEIKEEIFYLAENKEIFELLYEKYDSFKDVLDNMEDLVKLSSNTHDLLQAAVDTLLARDEVFEARDEIFNVASDIINQGNVPIYSTKHSAAELEIPLMINAIRINGADHLGDGRGGLYIDVDNGSSDTMVTGDGRTWYRVQDIATDRFQDNSISETKLDFEPVTYTIQEKSPEKRKIALNNLQGVSYTEQELSNEQQAQVRENIGAASQEHLNNIDLTKELNLSLEQQAQVRKNIGVDIIFNNREELEAAEISGNVQALRLNGSSVPGDGGSALYKRVSFEPPHNNKIQSIDGSWWERIPNVSDHNVIIPSSPIEAISAHKIKLDLSTSYTPTTVRLISDKFLDVISARDFGAFGASNDYTNELQAFLNEIKSKGLKAWIPQGDYGLSSTLVLNNVGIPGESPGVPLGKNGIYKRTAIVGDGAGATVFRLSGDIVGIHIQTGLGKAHHRGFSIVHSSSTDRIGVGLLVDQSQALKFSDIEVKGCYNGITNRDSFSMNYDSIDLVENINGFFGENVTSGSHPNAINFNSVRFMGNTDRGCYLINPTTCNFFGGSFEGNGSGSPETGGLTVFGPSSEGSFGVNVIGVYFENNAGDADVRITNYGGGDRMVLHRIKGCTFNRISSARYTTNNVLIQRTAAGYQKVLVCDNAFQGFGSYVPSANRKYILNVDTGSGEVSAVQMDNNVYGSPIEMPTV